jgi:hypothetical protein
MTDRPIIFSAPMIRALLDGRKTQTRRVLNPQPDNPRIAGADMTHSGWAWIDGWDGSPIGRAPVQYDPGDRLYVREAWRMARSLDAKSGKAIEAACLDAGYRRAWAPLQYEADGARDNWSRDDWPECTESGRYRHARFMPRWASRMTLTVTDVWVQPLQDISEADAVADGVDAVTMADAPRQAAWSRKSDFAALWNSLHGPAAWAANPWVVALTFTVQHGNIDAGGAS